MALDKRLASESGPAGEGGGRDNRGDRPDRAPAPRPPRRAGGVEVQIMLSPKKTKYRKQFKGRIHGLAKGGFALNFGSHGLKSVQPERITARQIEAARRAITRQMKRQGRVWIRIFPDVPVSDKPAEVRMGKGKGAVEYWAARVAPGRIMFEVDGVPDDVAREALRLGAAKLPVRTRIVTRLDAGCGARAMKIEDVRRLTPDELTDELLSLKKEQFNLRFQAATGQLEKTHRVEEVRTRYRAHQDRPARQSRRRPEEQTRCQSEFSKGWSSPTRATRPWW